MVVEVGPGFPFNSSSFSSNSSWDYLKCHPLLRSPKRVNTDPTCQFGTFSPAQWGGVRNCSKRSVVSLVDVLFSQTVIPKPLPFNCDHSATTAPDLLSWFHLTSDSESLLPWWQTECTEERVTWKGYKHCYQKRREASNQWHNLFHSASNPCTSFHLSFIRRRLSLLIHRRSSCLFSFSAISPALKLTALNLCQALHPRPCRM